MTALADDDDDEAADDEAELARTLDAMVESTRAAGAGARLHVVAFSGGVDSSLAAYVVHRAFGDGESGASSPRCAAAIGVSPSLPQSQLQIARDVASHIGIDLWEVPTNEGDVPEYVANEGESCLHCKNTLYSTLRDVAAAGIDSLASQGADSAVPGDNDVVLYNETNADDLTDPTRLGLLAASHHRVESPCCQLDKASVRRLARFAKLPNWNLAAAPCLRSRLATGVPATTQTLGDVEAAEAAVREALQIGASENMRVRVLSRAGDKALAALELEPSRVKMDDEVFDALSATLGTHGLWLSDVRAFESGSVAKRLDDGDIAKPAEWTSLFVHFHRPAVRSANDGGDLLERWEAEQCEIARAGGDGFVVSFGTTWCGPCHVLEPELETLARFVWDFDDSVAGLRAFFTLRARHAPPEAARQGPRLPLQPLDDAARPVAGAGLVRHQLRLDGHDGLGRAAALGPLHDVEEVHAAPVRRRDGRRAAAAARRRQPGALLPARARRAAGPAPLRRAAVRRAALAPPRRGAGAAVPHAVRGALRPRLRPVPRRARGDEARVERPPPHRRRRRAPEVRRVAGARVRAGRLEEEAVGRDGLQGLAQEPPRDGAPRAALHEAPAETRRRAPREEPGLDTLRKEVFVSVFSFV